MKYSIVIATYNRADDLRETLKSLAGLHADGPWEVIVVDNNSPDDTRQVVLDAAPSFPVPLRYLFEREQGRSPALNCGIRAAAGEIIATTDDDVRVPADWLNRAAAGLERLQCDYVGGRVLPIWGGPRPAWLPDHGGKQWAVIALLDYGPEPIEFGTRVPLGVNMAFRRSAFDRAGLFDPHTGRRAGTLLGQEVREWCIRARKAGVRGFYVPELALRHIIPAEPAEQGVFPALVLLARHQPRAALRALRPRHGSARADHARLLDRAARVRRAAIPLSQGVSRARRLAARHGPRPAHRGVRARAVALFLRRHRPAALPRLARAPDGGCPRRAGSVSAVPSLTGANTGAPAITTERRRRSTRPS